MKRKAEKLEKKAAKKAMKQAYATKLAEGIVR